MRRLYLTIILVPIILAAAFLGYLLFTPRILKEEFIGGKYNAKIIFEGVDERGFRGGEIVYTQNGTEHRGFYSSFLNSTLLWIEANTSKDAVFLNWWDYGHMIVGFTGRGTIIRNPSKEANSSISEPGIITEFDSNEKLVDVAKALTAADPNLTKSIMDKYNSSYILITTEDGGEKAPWIYQFAGFNQTLYVQLSSSSITFNAQDYTDLGKQTMIFRLLNGTGIEGFTQVYSNEDVKIFKLN